MPFRSVLTALAFALLSACTIHAAAVPPQPNVIVSSRHPGVIKIDTSAIPAGEVCSVQPGFKDFCIDHLRASLGTGLQSLLDRYVTGTGGPVYSAVFRFVEFSHSPASGGAHVSVQVAMRWQFELLDSNRRVVQLAQTTVGPEQIVNIDASDKVVQALLNSVLENIGGELNKATWEAQPAAGAAGPAAPAAVPTASAPSAPASH